MMTTPPPALRIRDLVLHRNGVSILDHLSWTVEQGERWAVIGANGSGKTALLNAVLAYMDMGAGEVAIFGDDYGDCEWHEVRKQVGLVSMGISRLLETDDSALDIVCAGKFGHLTPFNRPNAALRRAARAQLAAVNATHLADRIWAVLSQGERARVLIARALMAKPKVLVLDEPCTGLDPVARERYLNDLAERLQADPALTVIFVTHHIEEIPPEIDRVLVLAEGRAAFAGAKSKGLCSDVLSAAFKAPVTVRKRGGRYTLDVPAN
ncbi:MAG: ABC transporter ATP-binding protein [Planctomycetota bacterium]|jgi:iron complex transport system ATP-binding protein